MDVVGLGTFAMDILQKVNKLPREDDFCMIEDREYLPGGSGTNVISQVAKLGGTSAYIGKVGDDEVGKQIIASLDDENIDSSHMVISPNGTSIYTEIIIDREGKKFIMLNMGDVAASLTADEVDYTVVENTDVYFTDLFPKDAAIEGLKKAKEAGKTTVVNLQTGLESMESLGCTKDNILDALKYIDVFSPCFNGVMDITGIKNKEEIGKAKDFFRQYFSGTLLFTLGSDGAAAFDKADRQIFVEAKKVNAVDTTGAGDSFLGGFIYSYFTEGKALEEAMDFATFCAAYTCTGIGARYAPNKAQLKQFMESYEV